MAVGMGMMGAVDGNLGAQGQPFSPSRGFPSTQGSGTATTTLLGHLGPSLGEPGGSDGILWEIFFMRMTSPPKKMECTCKNKPALCPQQEDAFVLL